MRVGKLGKTAITAPLYISIAWGLIISYQFFTETAVYSVLALIGSFWSSGGHFLISNLEVIAFVHAFAWIFVLSSVIPSAILGRGRSVLLQFILCLTITLVAFSIERFLTLMIGAPPATQLQAITMWFQNSIIATLYLCAPYIFMLYLDLREKRKDEMQRRVQLIEAESVEKTHPPGEKTGDTMSTRSGDESLAFQDRGKGHTSFLLGTSVACFLLAIFTFWFGSLISSTIFSFTHKLIYAAILIALGGTLLGLRWTSQSTRKQVSIVPEELNIPSNIIADNVEDSRVVSTSIPETPPQEPSELPLKASVLQNENLVQLQIQEAGKFRAQMKNYDVRHPRDVVDSQC